MLHCWNFEQHFFHRWWWKRHTAFKGGLDVGWDGRHEIKIIENISKRKNYLSNEKKTNLWHTLTIMEWCWHTIGTAVALVDVIGTVVFRVIGTFFVIAETEPRESNKKITHIDQTISDGPTWWGRIFLLLETKQRRQRHTNHYSGEIVIFFPFFCLFRLFDSHQHRFYNNMIQSLYRRQHGGFI